MCRARSSGVVNSGSVMASYAPSRLANRPACTSHRFLMQQWLRRPHNRRSRHLVAPIERRLRPVPKMLGKGSSNSCFALSVFRHVRNTRNDRKRAHSFCCVVDRLIVSFVLRIVCLGSKMLAFNRFGAFFDYRLAGYCRVNLHGNIKTGVPALEVHATPVSFARGRIMAKVRPIPCWFLGRSWLPHNLDSGLPWVIQT